MSKTDFAWTLIRFVGVVLFLMAALESVKLGTNLLMFTAVSGEEELRTSVGIGVLRHALNLAFTGAGAFYCLRRGERLSAVLLSTPVRSE